MPDREDHQLGLLDWGRHPDRGQARKPGGV